MVYHGSPSTTDPRRAVDFKDPVMREFVLHRTLDVVETVCMWRSK